MCIALVQLPGLLIHMLAGDFGYVKFLFSTCVYICLGKIRVTLLRVPLIAYELQNYIYIL